MTTEGQFGKYALRVVDSSVFAALPKMTWALFGAGRARNDGKKTASVRFHVSFDPIALCPLACAVTSAAVDEKCMWPEIREGKSRKHKPECPNVDHQRWQIELFFWWLKKIMKVGHWLAQSEKVVRIQLYLAKKQAAQT